MITVPSYFNNSQRQATCDAAKIAGLNVLRIINEPTAAVLAYGLETLYYNEKQTVFVFDMGGGTTDITIATIERGDIRVISTCGDTHFGGQDFDNKLIEFSIAEFL